MASRPSPALIDLAPAKVNLTLRVLRRRRDGYHSLVSLVAFASVADRLRLEPGKALALKVNGPFAAAAGGGARNLVLRAAQALAEEVPGLRVGRFTLSKVLPVAAGLGGGSADAAAALRLLARANRLPRSDRRLARVAVRLGADVPVCLDPRPRLMRGIGDRLSAALRLPRLYVVLVNPGIALSTAAVFARFDRTPHSHRPARREAVVPRNAAALIGWLASRGNDLEPAAIALAPAIAGVLEALHQAEGCRLARMSGSGSTCFGLFTSPGAARTAAAALAARHPEWWVRVAVLN